MNEQKTSAMTPGHGWRRAKLVAGTLALTLGAFGTVAAVTALPASASVTSNPYTIGSPTGAVNSVTVSPTSVLAAASSSYTVTFVAPTAVASGGTVTIGDSTTGNSVANSATGVTIVSGSCLQSGGAAAGASGLVITLNSTSCSAGIAAGGTVSVGFSATNPSSGSSFNFTVSSSGNSTAAKSNTVTVSTSPPTLSVASQSGGANTTYTKRME